MTNENAANAHLEVNTEDKVESLDYIVEEPEEEEEAKTVPKEPKIPITITIEKEDENLKVMQKEDAKIKGKARKVSDLVDAVQVVATDETEDVDILDEAEPEPQPIAQPKPITKRRESVKVSKQPKVESTKKIEKKKVAKKGQPSLEEAEKTSDVALSETSEVLKNLKISEATPEEGKATVEPKEPAQSDLKVAEEKIVPLAPSENQGKLAEKKVEPLSPQKVESKVPLEKPKADKGKEPESVMNSMVEIVRLLIMNI